MNVCEDCGDSFSENELKPWRYNSEVLLCFDCWECRRDEEAE